MLDLLGGEVVAARAGQREDYAAIRSPLVAGSAPDAVLAALLEVSGARSAYVADLDAIMHGRPQWAVLARLRERFPATTLWLDAGFGSAADGLRAAAALQGAGASRVLPVLGSETLRDHEDLSGTACAAHCVLSLDFDAAGLRGDARWWQLPQHWPERVVVMTLARVGMAQGPDFARLQACRAAAADRRIYAAGGVRGRADLDRLQSLGLAGALVASALHAGRLGPA